MPTLHLRTSRMVRGLSHVGGDPTIPVGKPLENEALAKIGIATSVWPKALLQALLRFKIVERHFVNIGKEVVHHTNCEAMSMIFNRRFSEAEADAHLSSAQIAGQQLIKPEPSSSLTRELFEESRDLKFCKNNYATLVEMITSNRDLFEPLVKDTLLNQLETITSLFCEDVQKASFVQSPRHEWLQLFTQLLSDTTKSADEIVHEYPKLFQASFENLRPPEYDSNPQVKAVWDQMQKNFPTAWQDGLTLTAVQDHISEVMQQAAKALTDTQKAPELAAAALRVITDPSLNTEQQMQAAQEVQGGDWQRAELKVILVANGAPEDLQEAVLYNPPALESAQFAEPEAQAKLQELIKVRNEAIAKHHIPKEKADAAFIALLERAPGLWKIEERFTEELLKAGARPHEEKQAKRWRLELLNFATPGLRKQGRIKDETARDTMVQAFLKEFGLSGKFKRPSPATELLWCANELHNLSEGELTPEQIMAGCRAFVQQNQTNQGLASLSQLPKIKGNDKTVAEIAKCAFPAVLSSAADGWDESLLPKATIVEFFTQGISLDKLQILTSEHGLQTLKGLFAFTQEKLHETSWTVLGPQMQQALQEAQLTSLDKFQEIFSRMERERKLEEVRAAQKKANPKISVGRALEALRKDPARAIVTLLRPIVHHYAQDETAVLKRMEQEYYPRLQTMLEANPDAAQWIAAQLEGALPDQVLAAAKGLKLKSADAIEVDISGSLDEIEAALQGKETVWGQEVTQGLGSGFIGAMTEAKTEIAQTIADPKAHPKQFMPPLASLLYEEIPEIILGKTFGGRVAGWFVKKVGMKKLAKLAGGGLLTRFEGLIIKGLSSQITKYERELAQRQKQEQTPEVKDRIKSLQRNLAMVKLMSQKGMIPLLAEMTDAFLPQLVAEHDLAFHIPLLELMHAESHAEADQAMNETALKEKLNASAQKLIAESKAHTPWLQGLIPAFLSLGTAKIQ